MVLFADSGDAVFDLHGHEGVVRDLVFPQNGMLTLISSSRDKTLRIWDLAHKGLRTLITGLKKLFLCCFCSYFPESFIGLLLYLYEA